jgi:hypothetical protein
VAKQEIENQYRLCEKQVASTSNPCNKKKIFNNTVVQPSFQKRRAYNVENDDTRGNCWSQSPFTGSQNHLGQNAHQ